MMSVVKLLSRIDAPELKQTKSSESIADDDLQDHSYGFKDPLTQFAVLLSALVSPKRDVIPTIASTKRN